jgi:hypothetical protein
MGARDTRWTEMDHARIERDLVADRYWMGKLDEDQRQSFEAHFVDCAVCLERLETLESLHGALKELPPEQTAKAPAATSHSTSTDRFRTTRTRPLAALAAAACLLVATGASLFFYGEMRRARRELEAERQASERARERHTGPQGVSRARPADDPALSALRAAPLAAAVFTLNLTRGASADPADRVVLPASPGWLILMFDRPDGPIRPEYRVRLSTAGGQSVGEPVTASPASGGMLAVGLPSPLLVPGDYRLAVEDAASGNRLATYRFRAVPKR